MPQYISNSEFSNTGSSKNSAAVISSPRIICIKVLRLTLLFFSPIRVFIVLCGIAIFFSKAYCDILRCCNILLILIATAVLIFIITPIVVFTTIIIASFTI